MNILFKKCDFVLCKVPVPQGYPQSQTHSGIALLGDRFFLTTSPYPSIRRSVLNAYLRNVINKLTFYKLLDNREADSFENPCIYIGENTCYPPISFKPLTTNPLMNTPDSIHGLPSYNSDPDIFLENNNVFVLNRTIHRRPLDNGKFDYDCRLFLIKGELTDNQFRYMGTSVVLDDEPCGSPCLTKFDGDYYLFSIMSSCYIDGSLSCELTYLKSHLISDLGKVRDWKKVNIIIDGYTPWHMSVFDYVDKKYAVVACVKNGENKRCWQMLGEFNDDLSSLNIFKTPLTDYNSYRGAACVDKNGEFILYNTTVDEKIKGSQSVDGRNVIMTHAPFKKVLDELKK